MNVAARRKSVAKHTLRPLLSVGVLLLGALGAILPVSVAGANPAPAPEPKPVLQFSAGPVAPIKPAEGGSFGYEAKNTGNKATDGLAITIVLPAKVTLKDSHCHKVGTSDSGGDQMFCTFTDASGKIAPGSKTTGDLSLQVPKNLPGPQNLGKLLAVAQLLDAAGKPMSGTQKSDSVDLKAAANKYDVAVEVPKVSGGVGRTITVKGTVTNSGPSDVLGSALIVTAPTGTDIVLTPRGCTFVEPKRKLNCKMDQTFAAGKSHSVEVKIKVMDAKVGNDGTFAASSSTAGDTEPGNNSAPIRITATGSSGGGNVSAGSGDSGDDSDSPAGDGDSSPSLAANSDRVTSAPIPVTGVKAALLAGAGVTAVVAGFALLIVARRRMREAQGLGV